MKRIGILLIVLVFSGLKAEASFDKIGIGGRAIGMGTAFVAIASDASAIFWNPAGIAISNNNTKINRQFLLSYSPLFCLSYLQHKFIGYTQDRLISTANLGSLGLGIIELDLSPNTKDVQSLNYVENTFMLSWAYSFNLKPILHEISVGTTFKYYNVQTARNAFGYGFDLGLLGRRGFELNNWQVNLRFGFLTQDLGKSSIWYQGGLSPSRREFVEPNYRLGFAIDVKTGTKFFNRLQFAFDFNRRDKYSLRRNEVNIGTELSVYPNFDLRFGIQDLNVSRYAFGCGFIAPKLFSSPINLAIDVAVLTHPDLNNMMTFSISIFSGKKL